MSPWFRSLVLCPALVVVASAAFGAGLSKAEKRIVTSIDANADGRTALLVKAVNIPSATENLAGVRKVGELFAAELQALGFETRWVELPAEMKRAGHLVATRKGTEGKGLLLIGHLDTVLEGEKYSENRNRAYGSGAADMKGGDVIMIEALRALHANGALDGRQVVVVMTGDEENPGVPHDVSRAALVAAAKESDAALAFEGWAPGFAVVGRRGISSWRLEVAGSQGHSSQIFSPIRGDGAIFETARILQAFHDGLREPHLTFNPSLVVAGSDVTLEKGANAGQASGKLNIVADQAVVQGDLRFLSAEQLARARAKMKEIVSKNLPKTSAEITFEDGMPSMAPTEGNRELLKELDQVSRDLGTGEVREHDPSERGAGDISFVSTIVSGLDGLGALGEQEHAPGEYLELGELSNLTKRAAILIYRLTR